MLTFAYVKCNHFLTLYGGVFMFIFRVVVLALILLSVASIRAEERRFLSGGVSGVLPSGEYIVKSAITVRQGEALTLSAGTVLCFEQFTGIEVFGELSIEGIPAAPVVLTSVSDTGGAAQGFDWNGVDAVGASAVIRMRHARVGNSVYGVKVREFSASAEFEQVIFWNNGYASLMRGGQEIPLAVGEPFSAQWNVVQKPQTVEAPVVVENVSVHSAPKPLRNKKRIAFGVVGTGIAAAGLTLCAVNLSQMYDNFQRCNKEDDPRQSTKYKEEFSLNTTMSSVGVAVAGIGLLCVGITVFW
jgi:hypothetical protein